MVEPLYYNDPDALVTATYHCENDVVERLIADGIDVNCSDESGDTPLHAAAQQGWAHLISRLLEAGADPNKSNHAGDTPWDYASFYDHADVRDILESAGALRQTRKSACEIQQEEVYTSFSDVNAVMRLTRLMDDKKG